MSSIKIEEKLQKQLEEMFSTEAFQTKMNEFKAVEEDSSYSFKVVVTTEWIDRDGEVIKADWIDFSNYMKNPVVLIDHSYKIESIVWKTLRIYQENGVTIAEWVFAKGIENAELIRELYNQWFVKTVSIGFIPKQRSGNDRTVITKSEMLEFSFVAVPANPEALSLDGKTYQKCIDLWIIKEQTEEKSYQTEIVSAQDLKAWDVVTYRMIDRFTRNDWTEIEEIYPSIWNLPIMWKILAKFESGEEILSYNEVIIGKPENPVLIIQKHVASEDGAKIRTDRVILSKYSDMIIQRIVTQDELIKWFSEYDNSTQFDIKDVLNIIQSLKDEVSEMKTHFKTFADDKAEAKTLEQSRKMWQDLAKSLSAFLWEAKKVAK